MANNETGYIVLKKCKLAFARLHKPSGKFNPENPMWGTQIQTEDKAQRDEWKEKGLKVKTEINEKTEKPYYFVNLYRRQFNAKGEDKGAPRVIDGRLQPIDANSIGNGSIANINLFWYEGKDGQKVFILEGVQVLVHKVFVKDEIDPFEDEGETEVIVPDDKEEDADSDGDEVY
jgi:hypothetical protein